MIVLTSQGEKIVIGDKPLSSGGEGEIHPIKNDDGRLRNCCAKIYYSKKRTQTLENKIRYMVDHPPSVVNNKNYMLGWPIESLTDQEGHFIGFVMPLAFHGSKQLVVLTTLKLSKQLDGNWHERYDRNFVLSSTKARMKLLCNIAIPIHILHATNQYVFVDLKPENILVTYDGRVSVVDVDSVQIMEQNRLLYPCTAATPNYMPPEHYVRQSKDEIKLSSWADFALGVLFYQVLVGLHPFVVTPRVVENDINEIYRNIARELFPFGKNRKEIQGYPPVHDFFLKLPQNIQKLFVRAFSGDAGIRPTAEEWGRNLHEALKTGNMMRMPHIQGKFICPLCKAKIVLKEDYVLVYRNQGYESAEKIELTSDNAYEWNGKSISHLNTCPKDGHVLMDYDELLHPEARSLLEEEEIRKTEQVQVPDENKNEGWGCLLMIIGSMLLTLLFFIKCVG
ncbi:hypothetical protein [Mediterranea massiliensis]|uniref:protein kinase domain-containing protein n=1 Tax=Mediterranea massiliensis TaxID=1841865 RepID=UPI0023F4BF22|nr:hypothetical protein [Mediterranea massiliensis]